MSMFTFREGRLMNIIAAISAEYRYYTPGGGASYPYRHFLSQLEGVRGGIPTNIFRKNVCDYHNLMNYKIDDDDLSDEYVVSPLRKDKPLHIISFIRLVSGVESHLLAYYVPYQYRKRTVFKVRHRGYTVRKCKNI